VAIILLTMSLLAPVGDSAADAAAEGEPAKP
jgi:hypothetical protein